ncbi:hypothetical protein NCS52_01505600 [Fusarium sp. LHS14.1]|nr:hypothetical protein NCS52_01505600 [Fusarium sp. LHS14.1]
MGYSISNTAITCVGSLAASLGGGGRVVFIWGLLLVFFMASAVACSLDELSSAMPHAGGQHYWESQLAPPKIRRGLSYLVGFLSWSSTVVTAALRTLALPQFELGMVVLVNPNFIVRPWMVFVGYQVTNVLIFCFNLISMVTTLVMFVILLVTSSSKASGREMFAKVDNVTGWPDGVAFISAMVGPNWGFACLDAVTHMAEEIPNPRTNIHRVLIATVTLGISIGFPVIIRVILCVTDFNSVVGTATGVPSL